uniref:Uncharacterized protein n=1 Tax=uncultured prokaryote TaxID=198431 RepID=A0A0H5PWN9_9ZZZZ|nr:hypothetical protein [uncultured prokaryote]
MASTLPHSHSPQLAGGKGPGPLLAGPCCPGGRGQTLSGSVLLPARSCGLSWSAQPSPGGEFTHLVGGSEHGGALGFKDPTLLFSRSEPGTSQGYHPHMGRERPRSACGTGPAHWGRRSPPTLLAPCSRAAPPSALAADDTVGPDSRAPSAGSILCMGSTTPHRLAVCWGPLRVPGGHGRTAPRYVPAPLGRRSPGGGAWTKKQALPAGVTAGRAWDVKVL